MASFDHEFIVRNQSALNNSFPLLGQLNENWDQIEHFFREQGILRGASYCYEEIFSDEPNSEKIGENLLGIQKIKGSWRICFGCGYLPFQSEEVSWTPISDAPLSVRIEMIDFVGCLFKEMTKSNEMCLLEIEEAVRKSRFVLPEVNSKRA